MLGQLAKDTFKTFSKKKYALVSLSLFIQSIKLAIPAFYISAPFTALLERYQKEGSPFLHEITGSLLMSLMTILLIGILIVIVVSFFVSIFTSAFGGLIFLLLGTLSILTRESFVVAGILAGAFCGFCFDKIFNPNAFFDHLMDLNYSIIFSFSGCWIAFSAYPKMLKSITASEKREAK